MNRLPFPAQAAALLVLLLLAVALPPSAPAAELTHWVALPMLAAPHGVLLAGDEAELRAAILAANAATGRPRIELTADIVLNAPLPPLDNTTRAAGVFNGAGYTLDGDGHGPILTVAADTRVIFEDLIITGGGQPEGATVCGGAALVRGEAKFDRVRLEGNSAGRGGALCILGSGSITIDHSVVAGNSAAEGGGVFVRVEDGGGAILSVYDSTFEGNRAAGLGGAIHVTAWEGNAFTYIGGSTLHGNTAAGGAGLYNSGNAQAWDSAIDPGFATASVQNSTFSGNVAAAYGGAIANLSYLPEVPVPPRRRATPTPPALGFGEIELLYVTITANAAARGSGVFNYEDAILIAGRSILAGNDPGGDCWRPVTESRGYNLDGDGSCGLEDPADLPEGSADLLPLAPNAPGQTATHALGPASDARDRIPDTEPGCNEPGWDFDQRGVPRPQGPQCDIGAFEAE